MRAGEGHAGAVAAADSLAISFSPCVAAVASPVLPCILADPSFTFSLAELAMSFAFTFAVCILSN
nr:unnamed protein product [Digitaria exilis]